MTHYEVKSIVSKLMKCIKVVANCRQCTTNENCLKCLFRSKSKVFNSLSLSLWRIKRKATFLKSIEGEILPERGRPHHRKASPPLLPRRGKKRARVADGERKKKSHARIIREIRQLQFAFRVERTEYEMQYGESRGDAPPFFSRKNNIWFRERVFVCDTTRMMAEWLLSGKSIFRPWRWTYRG